VDWIEVQPNPSNYILDRSLADRVCMILVTYQNNTGLRYVAAANCNHGYVGKKIPGRIIAWMPMPKPYKLMEVQK
jgi:hypothetical protein